LVQFRNFGKIVKIVATRCHILKPKCTKFDFGWGSAPDPAGGAYSAPQTPAGFKGPASKEKKEEGRRKGWEGKGERKGKEKSKGGKEGEGADIAWSDLYLSQRDATAAASGPVWF